MTSDNLKLAIQKMIDSMSAQVPTYKSSAPDWNNSEGNVAVCIIDDEGNVYGKIWGNDKLRGRKIYDIAYRKAVQVWITGYKTGEYEKLVFTEQLNYREFGIDLPDLMGWKGGQPIQLDADTRISCGFSGFKGVTDLAIVTTAAEEAMK
jgi:glc operon protein GlcG